MKTWDNIKYAEIEVPEIMENFINEVVTIMKKYNLSISHEDSHGAFMIENYDEYNVERFRQAMKNY